MNTLQLLPFYELDDREFSFVNHFWSRQLHELVESDLYNLLPNLDKNDEVELWTQTLITIIYLRLIMH